MFIEVPLFSETFPALKNSWLRAWKLQLSLQMSFKALRWTLFIKLLDSLIQNIQTEGQQANWDLIIDL